MKGTRSRIAIDKNSANLPISKPNFHPQCYKKLVSWQAFLAQIPKQIVEQDHRFIKRITRSMLGYMRSILRSNVSWG